MSNPLPVLISTGNPDHVGLETNVRRMADQLHGQIGDAMAYEPNAPGVWASPAPTTVADALDRIAVTLKVLYGSPIP